MLVPAADTKIDTQVNVCRRVNGSGTQVLAGTMTTERMREVIVDFVDTSLASGSR